MGVRGHITYEKPPDVTLKELRPAVKEALQRTVLEWWRRYMPGHFRNEAKGKYSYQPRTAAYEKRKARQKGHRRPLVWSGLAERQAKRYAKTSGTSKRATLSMDLPGYFYKYLKTGKQVDKNRELTETTEREAQELAEVLDMEMQALLFDTPSSGGSRTVTF